MSALPNVLTVLRLIAVPIMVVFYVLDFGTHTHYRVVALVIFMVAGATDMLDGYLARRWKVVSDFGKLADPIADKALVLAALCMMASGGELPWWPVIIIAAREIGVTVGRMAVASNIVIPASPGGKLKTIVQMLAVFLYLLPGVAGVMDTIAWCTLLIATVLALATGVDYAVKIGRAVQQQRENTTQPRHEPA